MTLEDGPETAEDSGVAAARRWRRLVAAEERGGQDESLDVVFVCTGNRFRSPLAAALLEQATVASPVAVRSVGTLNAGNPRALPETIAHGRRFGLDLSGHRAQPLANDAIKDADLVLGFEQMHVAVAVMEGGADRARAFTLPELVELLALRPSGGSADVASAATVRAAITQAATARAHARHDRPTAEVADPMGRSPDAFTRTADEIQALVTRLVHELFG